MRVVDGVEEPPQLPTHGLKSRRDKLVADKSGESDGRPTCLPQLTDKLLDPLQLCRAKLMCLSGQAALQPKLVSLKLS